ncbi:SDR family NAD(P)-dependent oxidoreductase [Acuticoccus kandeliae]|uniref:SDR family NAD(P)-dependent oxidoreductase n=1 Tax=Acuticoccus kandeliae TaxID=2073160 RepID=UPI000D3E1DF3|nr:SDR family oxidoreductase [Acuticoccus kandeliae]
MNLELGGKAALVTGATRGIGNAIARTLLAEGASVALNGRSAQSVEAAIAALGDAAAAAIPVVSDVATPEGAVAAVEACVAGFGSIDCLVANVGGSSGDWLTQSTSDDWSATFRINLFHAVDTIRAAVPHFKARGGGSVVIIASISGWKTGSRAQYATAKAAEIQLAQSLGAELAPDNIRVNTVSPGSVLYEGGGWERTARTRPDDMARFIADEFPGGRLGTAEEIADVVAFLLSPRASWVNAAHIPVDGAQGRPTIR